MLHEYSICFTTILVMNFYPINSIALRVVSILSIISSNIAVVVGVNRKF